MCISDSTGSAFRVYLEPMRNVNKKHSFLQLRGNSTAVVVVIVVAIAFVLGSLLTAYR